METNLENIRIYNDNKSNTQIKINIDNSKINHSQLNKFIAELADLGLKYSIIPVKEGVLNGNN